MLRNKSDYSCHKEQNKENYARVHPSSLNAGGIVQLISIPELLVMSSNNVSGNTTIATRQITRSDQTLSNKRTFRQIFSLGSVRHKAGVPRGRRSSERLNGALLRLNGQRVFSVNPFDGTPIELVSSKDVVHNNLGFRNSHTWIPKQQPRKEGKPDVQPSFSEKYSGWFCGQSPKAHTSENKSHQGHDSSRSGMQQLRSHFSSLTHPNSKVGASR